MLLYYINGYLLYLQDSKYKSEVAHPGQQKKQNKKNPETTALFDRSCTNSPSLPTRAGVIKNKTEIKSSRTSKIKPTSTALIGQRDLVLNQRYIIRCRNLVLLCEEGNARIKRLERGGEKTNENKIK